MAYADVIGCVTAVASAFQGGADIVQAIMERRDKKKWRKDKDQESAFQERMLHRALVDAASQCQNTALDRRQRFGQVFDQGDHIAVSELKDVIIGFQATVTNALQHVRHEKNATLDFPRLHENVILQKTKALQSIDDLCRRSMRAVPTQRSYSAQYVAPQMYAPEKQDYGWQSAQRSMSADWYSPHQRPAPYTAATTSASYTGNPGYIDQSLVQTPSSIQTTPISMMARQSSNASTSTYNSWHSGHRRQMSDISSVRENPAAEEYASKLPALDELSLHDSAMGSIIRSKHRPAASVTSTATTDDGRTSFASENKLQKTLGRDLVPESRTMSVTSDLSIGCGTGSSTQSQFASPDLAADEGHDDDDEVDHDERNVESRASGAPEVVTREYESMLSSQTRERSVRMKHPTNISNIHPAHRQLYIAPEPGVIAPDPDRIWSPLARPAKINNYHGFCKSAWQIRESVQEGLSIAMIPTGKIGDTVPHWKCKMCEFRSQATSDSNALPTQVYYSSTGIRYKWLFLAKSHLPTNDAKPKPEAYAYGCIFCAAQGRETAVHANLDALMGHIVGKHKTAMLTPEVLEKTKCVVGTTVEHGKDWWDVNLPEKGEKRFGVGRVGKAVRGIVSEH